jgi:hypothetical protein
MNQTHGRSFKKTGGGKNEATNEYKENERKQYRKKKEREKHKYHGS